MTTPAPITNEALYELLQKLSVDLSNVSAQMQEFRKEGIEGRADLAQKIEHVRQEGTQERKEIRQEGTQERKEIRSEMEVIRREGAEERKEIRHDMRDDFREVKYDMRMDKEKLEKVYDSRDKVTVNFTRAWMFSSFFIALSASTITLAVAKAF